MNETEEEFGRRGVENPDIVDLITFDSKSGEVVLVIIEDRPWDGAVERFVQYDEKLNNYMIYILDGHLAKQYPQYVGKPARIQLDCTEPPTHQAATFLENVAHVCGINGVRFVVNVVE